MIGSIGNLNNIIYSDSILSAVHSADRFFYAVFDAHHRLINASLEPIEKSELADLVSRGFKKKILTIDGTSIHLPEGMAGGSLLEDYSYSIPHSQSYSDHLLGLTAETHYLLDKKTGETLQAFFEPYEIFHQSTIIANYLFPAVKDKVMLLGGDNYMYITVMGQQGLKMVKNLN